MKKSFKREILDWIFIIINVTSSLSIVDTLIFDRIPVPSFLSLFLLNVLLFLLRWGAKFTFFMHLKKNILFIVFFLIYFFDIFQNIVIDPKLALARIMVLFYILLFLCYVNNLYVKSKGDDDFYIITKPYTGYCFLNVVLVVVTGLLIFIGIVNPETNEFVNNSLMADNLASGQIVYWPAHLSIAIGNSRLLAAWGIPVTLTGLSHEPHVLNFLILPSLFFIKAYGRFDKLFWVLFTLYLISLFFSFSTTALATFLFVIFLDVIWRIIVKQQKSFIFYLLAAFTILIWINEKIDFISLIQDELFRKTVEQTGSLDYSGAMLKYVVSPQLLLGTGNLPQTLEHLDLQDVGMLTSFLDVLFYFLLAIFTFRLCSSRDDTRHYIGLGCAYMLIHMLKVNFLAFIYPYLAFIVFILYVYNNKKIVRVKYTKQ